MGKVKHTCRDPRYVTKTNDVVDLIYTHPSLGELPFSASKHDVEPLGREIYELAVRGAFGEVSPYQPPSEEVVAGEVRQVRDDLLQQLDKVVTNPLRFNSLTPEQVAVLTAYRQDLLDLPQQVGFPNDVVFPETPDFI